MHPFEKLWFDQLDQTKLMQNSKPKLKSKHNTNGATVSSGVSRVPQKVQKDLCK